MNDGVCVSDMIPSAGAPQDVYYLGNVPARLRNETARVQRENEERARRSLLEKVPRTRFRYYCSACLIIRDENEYLEEWLRWHIGQGVEHFYIYDHGSKQPVREFLQTLDNVITDRVTVTEWKGRHADAQPDAYNDCLRRFREESRWIAFVDADEQIHVKTGQTLPEFLKGYEQYAGVMAVWVTYDANGMLRKTSGTLRERFTRVFAPDEFSHTAGKLIAQAMFTDKMYVHNGRAAKGFIIADERGNAVRDYALMPENATTDLICVDHYYTKSYEEWLNKLRRGSGHARYSRAYEDFFKFNPDMTGHRENIRYRQFDFCIRHNETARTVYSRNHFARFCIDYFYYLTVFESACIHFNSIQRDCLFLHGYALCRRRVDFTRGLFVEFHRVEINIARVRQRYHRIKIRVRLKPIEIIIRLILFL